jgi:hypothetical protein
MGLGSGGNMRALDGRVQMNPAIFQGQGKGDTPANKAGVRDAEKFFQYNEANANIGATKENLTKEQIKERDKMGLLGKSIWDFVNKRYIDHKNDIQQVSFGIANDGRISVKGNASLGDINKFVSENNKEFQKLLNNLSNPQKGVATRAENRITGLLSEFLGRVALPTRGQIFAETHNQLNSISDKHKEIRDYIRSNQWNKVASFKTTKETQWAKSYVTAAKSLMKNAKTVNGKVVARQGRNASVQKRLNTLNGWRDKGSSNSRALSLAKINSNISRLNAQMRETSNRARQFGVPLSTSTQNGVATYKAQMTQHVRDMVKGIRKDAGLRKLSAERIIGELRKETQKRRGKQA